MKHPNALTLADLPLLREGDVLESLTNGISITEGCKVTVLRTDGPLVFFSQPHEPEGCCGPQHFIFDVRPGAGLNDDVDLAVLKRLPPPEPEPA